MMNELVINILNGANGFLTVDQLVQLKELLYIQLNGYNIEKKSTEIVLSNTDNNSRLLRLFLATKSIEGKSGTTIQRYNDILTMMIESLSKDVTTICTNDLRAYLANYKSTRKVCNNTLDGMRRIITSFFGWLFDEKYISEDPSCRLQKIKSEQKVKTILSDEEIEKLRMHCENDRDIAIIDLLCCSGIRIGELVKLNISDINFKDKEVIIHGKGNKQRTVYINGKTKIRIEQYLLSRNDDNPALFVSLNKKNCKTRCTIAGIESRIKHIASNAGVNNVHPHKFRRTMATNAIKHKMPIENVSALLGHAKISTTQIYITLNNENVKKSYECCVV